MMQFVLHSDGREFRRGLYSSIEWFQAIQEIHSKEFCCTFSMTPEEVFDNDYKRSTSPHHSVGPTLELASVGQKTEADKWQNAGWLCSFIKSSVEISSFRGSDEILQYQEYSIYTGVHIVESNCIFALERLTPVLASFLATPQIETNEDWLDYDDVFMTHGSYYARQNGG